MDIRIRLKSAKAASPHHRSGQELAMRQSGSQSVLREFFNGGIGAERAPDAIEATPELASSLALLEKGPVSEDDLCADLMSRGAGHLLSQLFFLIERYKSCGWIDYSILVDGALLAAVVPTSGKFRFPQSAFDAAARYQLCRFALLRRDNGAFIMESAILDARLVIENAGGAAVAALLAKPSTLSEVVEQLPALPAQQITAWMDLFARLNLVSRFDAAEPSAMVTWEFHDALFHHATRSESLLQATGATARFRGTLPAPPAEKPDAGWEPIELEPPVLSGDRLSGPSFWDVLDTRRSSRVHSATPFPRATLSEFLYRVARIKKIKKGQELDTLFRTYPAAGALHEIEFYVVVNCCDELSRGLYHYNSARHTLARSPAGGAEVEELLADAARSWKRARHPQVLIILASRFARIAWAYERIAYRLTLLNAGVIVQTMYLVAAAMGLAACAVGWGSSSLFARAAGLNPFEEASVAEFALGLPEQGAIPGETR